MLLTLLVYLVFPQFVSALKALLHSPKDVTIHHMQFCKLCEFAHRSHCVALVTFCVVRLAFRKRQDSCVGGDVFSFDFLFSSEMLFSRPSVAFLTHQCLFYPRDTVLSFLHHLYLNHLFVLWLEGCRGDVYIEQCL